MYGMYNDYRNRSETGFYVLLFTALRVEETWERTPEVLFLCFIVDSPTSGGDVGACTGSAVEARGQGAHEVRHCR
jgi:hypothetical protein